MDTFTLFTKENWPRWDYYYYYINRIRTRYNITQTLDITDMHRALKEHHLKFFPSMLYLIMREVNSHQEFKIARDEDDNPGWWNVCHPQYTLFHPESETFSDIWSEYSEDYRTFYANVTSDIETYRNIPGLKPKPGRPENFTSVSSVPWLSYDSVAYDSLPTSPMIYPLIIFGKYYEKEGRILLPFSISVNHACADGFHTCRFINELQELCNRFGNGEFIQ